MNVEKIMTQPVRTIGRDWRLDAAADLMWKADCGSLPVVDDEGRVVAMLTDRDILMHAWSKGRSLHELTVDGAMSDEVIVCHAADPVERAEKLMQSHQIRRLPVVDKQGHAIGILSLGDLSREALLEERTQEPQVTDSDVVRTLAAVSLPRLNGNDAPAGAKSLPSARAAHSAEA